MRLGTGVPLAGLALGLALAGAPWWPGCRLTGDTMTATTSGVIVLLMSVVLWLAFRHLRARQRGTWHYLGATATVLVLGLIVAGVVIPNLVGALDRGKQKRTMGDMRTLATAIEQYSIDFTTYPRVEGDAAALAPLIEPTYVKRAFRLDGWGNPFEVTSQAKSYRIVSRGCCGEPDGPDMHAAPNGGTTDFRADMVFENGAFVRFPDGAQR